MNNSAQEPISLRLLIGQGTLLFLVLEQNAYVAPQTPRLPIQKRNDILIGKGKIFKYSKNHNNQLNRNTSPKN